MLPRDAGRRFRFAAAAAVALALALLILYATRPRPEKRTAEGASEEKGPAAIGAPSTDEADRQGRAASGPAAAEAVEEEVREEKVRDEALRRKLAKPVSVNVIGASMQRMLDWVDRTWDITITVEEDAGVLPKAELSMSVEKMPLGAALRWACRQAGSSYRLEEGGVVVVPGAGSRMRAPPPDEAAKAWLAAAGKTLESRVSFPVARCDIGYALDTLFKISGMNFVIDHAVDRTRQVGIRADDVPLRAVLETLCAQAECEFALVDYAVFVGSAEAVAQVAGRKPPADVF